MAVANTIFLIRRTNGRWVQYSGCTAVSLTGQIASYGSVTGVASTNVITVPSSAFLNGYGITFTNLAGGAGLVANVKYYVVNASGATFKLATSQGGTAIDFTTDITSATTILVQTDELFVWSSEYRDVFSGLGTQQGAVLPVSSNTAATMGAPQGYGIGLDPDATLTPTNITTGSVTTTVVAGTAKIFLSDDIYHAALRQTDLPRTHWKFTMSEGPSPLYATWADGDIIANNPPNT